MVAGVVLAWGAVAGPCQASEPPRGLIFDTDAGGDCDDIGALFLLHGAVERGEVKLLGTLGCTSSKAIAPCLDAVNTWFGRPDVPVGTLKDDGLLPNPGYTAEVARRFPHRFAESKDYPDAVVLYRQLLAKQPDNSVVVVAVGPLRNLANLLRSRADDVSPLDGKALVARKVKRLDVMGGTYPPTASANEAEWNFKMDPASAALVCSNWPTEILFNGEGGSTSSGRRVTYEMPEHNPLTVAYTAYPGVGYAGDRLSWDPVSCLVAVRGAAPWYRIVSGGANTVDPKTGVNTWQPGGKRDHSYLVLDPKRPKREVEAALEDLMVAGKGRPAKLTVNTAYYAQAGACRVTSRGSLDANSPAIKAFDREDKGATSWIDRAAASWIQCQYADGRKRLVTSYVVECPAKQRRPRALELCGSNDDGRTWTRLDVRDDPGFTDAAPRRTFSVAAPAKWNAYRLNLVARTESEGVEVSTIELNEDVDCRPTVAVRTLALDHPALSLPAGCRATLNATLAPLDSFEREVTWVSSDPAVAAVRRIGEQTAVVVGNKPGTCVVTATVGQQKGTCAVTVGPSTLPADWRFDELNAPPVPGSIDVTDGTFRLSGCGHAMTSWWERVRDQGVFVSRAAGDVEVSVRLTALAPNVGGPNAHPGDARPPTAAGLMVRDPLAESCGRFFLVQVESSGAVVCRWRSKAGDQDDNKSKVVGKATLPLHLKLVQKGGVTQVYTSADGADWGKPLMSHSTAIDTRGRIGMFTCSGNTFVSTTAVFDSVRVRE
ncbi:nucleoside hydrolase [Gemmata sp.]|uniref:nucleoside hydrolase n=1 Tax=Gemmata sp. TaxID=1914242 RepID=UPI003F6F3348